MSRTLSYALPLALALSGVGAGAAHAAEPVAYPDKPVRVYTGFAAGGPTDVIARSYAQYAGTTLKQPFIVENRPGANTILAAGAVAVAAPDGYTLLAAATNHTMIPALYSDRVKFDALKSFAPVCTVAISPTVLVVRSDYPAKDTAGFLADVRAHPGKRTYATPGIGSSGHFATELLAAREGLQMVHVPYKGAAPAMNDLMAGQVDMSFATLASVLPQIKAGKLRALAVAAPQRSALLPDVPTFKEGGVNDYRADAWYGILAPAGTPASVLATLQQTARAYVADDRTKQTMAAMGLESNSVCGADLTAQIAKEIDTYTGIARKLKLSGE
ncbi:MULTISPECIES: tripartite tricarboxylate transporter substrate binding protein [unclassified Achromobacter]|uniref:Bug family tripartite tricarboxylate transporter substrate binding protein n=1 Tax=unclassified Achromobacter TaxID=2626865 RepID=UPI000B5195D7|nr:MULTISPECIES: tripartite tricarboxylate transporter substrate binding protein [unclassified Achromobacter]OWT77622.1 twin-arginine translocation pathway signal [Achromobacter sp. HZ28]OWT78670.1 twin-arginine translocation pathway signal [Achromobacter sp. HZ34]